MHYTLLMHVFNCRQQFFHNKPGVTLSIAPICHNFIEYTTSMTLFHYYMHISRIFIYLMQFYNIWMIHRAHYFYFFPNSISFLRKVIYICRFYRKSSLEFRFQASSFFNNSKSSLSQNTCHQKMILYLVFYYMRFISFKIRFYRRRFLKLGWC